MYTLRDYIHINDPNLRAAIYDWNRFTHDPFVVLGVSLYEKGDEKSEAIFTFTVIPSSELGKYYPLNRKSEVI